MKRFLITVVALGLVLTACTPGSIPTESTSGTPTEGTLAPVETIAPTEPTVNLPPDVPDLPVVPTQTVPQVPEITETLPPESPTETEPTPSESPTDPSETEAVTVPSSGADETVPVIRPTDPKPSVPAATEPSKPTATVPSVTDPVPTHSEDTPTDPPATNPSVSTKPSVTAPSGTKPTVARPSVTEPTVTEPPVTTPSVTVPPVTIPPATDPPATKPSATEPTATTPSVTAPPAATEPPVTKPPVTEPSPTQCSHHYSLTGSEAASCTSPEILTYTCTACGDSYTETSGSPEPHSFNDATCIQSETCSRCGATGSAALGHKYNSYALCTRCGESEPGPIEIIITIKDSKNNKLSGISVRIFMDDSDIPTGTGMTAADGTAHIMVDQLKTYQVILSDLPAGVTGNSSYTFGSKRANINLKVQPVLDPTDHSKADYQRGSTMADFTLTDTDGNLYTLYELLKEKELVILDFWYCMCTPCKSEFPYFDAALDQYGDRISLLALNPIDSEDAIIQLRNELGCTFPMLLDTVNLYRGFDVTAYPVTVFIGSDGTVLSIHSGAFSSQKQFLNEIEKHLK